MSSEFKKFGRPVEPSVWGDWYPGVEAAGGVAELAKLLGLNKKTLERIKSRPPEIVPEAMRLWVDKIFTERLALKHGPFQVSKNDMEISRQNEAIINEWKRGDAPDNIAVRHRVSLEHVRRVVTG